MKNITAILIVLVGIFFINATNTETANKKIPVNTSSQKFIIKRASSGKHVGHCEIKTEINKPKDTTKITEMLSIDYKGSKIEYTSNVTYKNDPLKPESADVITKVDNKKCMTGSIEFSKKQYKMECMGLLNARTGKSFPKPEKYSMDDQPVPDGFLLFQSAFLKLGTKLLSTSNEFKNVVCVEFPDDFDAPELVNFKDGHRLVKTDPEDDGSYFISLKRAPFKGEMEYNSNNYIMQAKFDKNNNVIYMNWGTKFKLVPENEQSQKKAK